MYITKVELIDVRCFDKQGGEIDLGDDKKSLLIAGNNGSGKSAIVRSIAMGLCDTVSAGSLLRELLGDFIRKIKDESSGKNISKDRATIAIELKHSDSTYYQIHTIVSSNDDLIFEKVDQIYQSGKMGDNGEISWVEITENEFKWKEIFITAYGAGIRTDGSEDYSQFFAADAVYSLFKYSHHLQNPELVWRRLVEVARDKEEKSEKERDNTEKSKERKDEYKGFVEEIEKAIPAILRHVLNLENDHGADVAIENNGIFVSHPDWGKFELDALGDGYRTITTVILDILSWLLLMQNNNVILDNFKNNTDDGWEPLSLNYDKEREIYTVNSTGIVIIDEIEKHLHPQLQREIMDRLCTIFKNIQFIITTHSPLCLSGTDDVEDGGFKIYSTKKDEERNSIRLIPKEKPNGMKAEQILDHYFGVPSTRNKKLDNKLDKYVDLHFKGSERNAAEEKEFKGLGAELKSSNVSSFLEARSKIVQKELHDLDGEDSD